MEIERINENTIKFYISYMDIEDLGFEREEIWYDRERSEQLFWQMMDEVHHKEDFNVEGPLWIQVQALEKGLEILVTKAKITKDGDIEMDEENKNERSEEKMTPEQILAEKYNYTDYSKDLSSYLAEDDMQVIVSFKEFEDVIGLSHYMIDFEESIKEVLYSYKGKYYLVIEFDEYLVEEDEKEDIISRMMEFSKYSEISTHLLEEYGTKIFDADVFSQVRSYFPIK